MLATGLQRAREDRGWSVVELAERAGLTAQHIRRLESGTGSAASVEAVAQVLELRLSHMPISETLPGQIKAQRERRGWTISAFAAISGLSRMTVRSLENGGGSCESLNSAVITLAPKTRFKAPAPASWSRATKRAGDDQFTPSEFLAKIEAIFGQIELDPAWHLASSVKATRTYSLAAGCDGMAEHWSADFVWLNPPFSSLLQWLRKADKEWAAGRAKTIVALVPARTDSSYFHDRLISIADVYLVRGRLRFTQLDGRSGNQAPFPLMLVLFGATPTQRTELNALIPGLWVSVNLGERTEGAPPISSARQGGGYAKTLPS